MAKKHGSNDPARDETENRASCSVEGGDEPGFGSVKDRPFGKTALIQGVLVFLGILIVPRSAPRINGFTWRPSRFTGYQINSF